MSWKSSNSIEVVLVFGEIQGIFKSAEPIVPETNSKEKGKSGEESSGISRDLNF